MKKTFIALFALMATTGSAFAESKWHTDPTNSNLQISAEEEYGASLPQVQETKDGKFWITWLTWQEGMNGYIKAQLLDKDGNALLDEGGIYVMKRPTATWTSNYGMNVTPDGNLVVCHSDCGDDPDRQAFLPHVYMLDQEGNQLWGINGVELPTIDASGHRPKVGVTNEGTIFVGFNDISHASNETGFKLFKMNNDGTMAWANPIAVNGMFGAFAPCEDDDIYLSIINGGAITLQRYDSMGDPVWEDTFIVEDREPNTRGEIQPISDELGGVIMPYQRYISLSVCYPGMQRISPDGEGCMGLHGLDLSEELGQHSAPGICVNGKRQEIVAAWNFSEHDNNYILIQKFDYSGTPLWDEPVKYGGDYMWGYATTHGKVLDDGSAIICYDDKHAAVSSDIKIMKIDANGDEIWTKQISPEAYISEPILFFDQDKGEGYIFMTDDRRGGTGASPSGGIFAQNFKLVDEGEVSADRIYDQKGITLTYADGTLGINAAQEGTAHIYDATGALVASYAVSAGQNSYSIDAAHGLYIVRVNCGDAQVTKKVCF